MLKVSPTNNSININSDDSESVNMWNIIEQHFKEEIFTMPTLSNQIVCKKCWELLKSFHEFYNQVTQAHLQAHNKLKALQELEITVTDIKEEPDAVDKLALQELAEITVTEVKVEPDVVDTLASSPVNFHDSKERTIYRCGICEKSFYRREVLARHYLTHAPEEQRNVKCTQCEKTFCNQQEHLNLSHLNLYAKICDICGKSVNGSEAFQRHQDEHADVQRTLEKCKICNMELKTKYGLARHIKTMHTEPFQTPQICPVCSKVSPTLRAHKTHMEYMHSGKKHICTVCDKTFKLPKSLREHMATHTGEILYTCIFCSQTFNSKSNMYAHRKRKHPKEWTEKCAKQIISTRRVQ